MSATVTYKCSNCGAGLVFDAEKQSFSCDFCISSFTEDELRLSGADKRAEEAERAEDEFRSELREYHCDSCGAEILTDKSTVADFCYYCHNPIVLSDRVSGAFRPTKVIPFKFDKDEAKKIFHDYCKKKWFLPKDYFSPEHSDKICGIYYPFWVVDADSSAGMNAKARKVRSWRQGNYRYTETSHYAITRRANIHFEDISSSAISTEDKAMLEGILPYPTDEYLDFSIPYLQGYQAKKRDLSREDLTEDVRGKMTSYAESLLSSTVVGYSSVDSKSTSVSVEKSHWEYALTPIWILNYMRKGKNYLYAMNGSTGKIYGELPVSIPKLAILGGLVSLAVGIVSFLIGWGML